MSFKLQGKKVLLTGATGGIGRAIVFDLFNSGADVVAVGTNEAKLRSLFQEVEASFGKRLHYFVCDLSNESDAQNLYQRALDLFQYEFDVLVCNAGITRDNLAIRMKVQDWKDVLDVNLTSVFLLNKAAVKGMIRRRSGSIINISSVIGFTGNIGQANYAAAKAGLIAMSKSIALECAARGVRVNCIAPGFIDTPMTASLSSDYKEMILKKIPMQRMGDPEEIAKAVLFLASECSSYITGTTLHVNGGMHM